MNTFIKLLTTIISIIISDNGRVPGAHAAFRRAAAKARRMRRE